MGDPRRNAGLFFLLFCTSTILGQTHKSDSLIAVLETKKLSEKEQIKIYKKISESFLRNDIEKLTVYAQKGLKLAEKSGDEKSASEFLQQLGTGSFTKGDIDAALAYFDRALAICSKIKYEKLEAMIYGSIANIYTFNNKESEAMDYSLKALAIFERLGDKKYTAVTLSNISNIHQILQNNQQAFEYIQRAKVIADELNDDYLNAIINRKLAYAYYENEEYDKAIEYDLKTLEYSRSIGDVQGEVISLEGLALSYYEGKEDYETAEKYALECLAMAEKFDDPRLYVTANNILSSVYFNQKRFEDSKNTSLKVWEKDSLFMKDFKVEFDGILTNLVRSYIHLGDKESAVYFFDQYKVLVADQTDESFQGTIANMEVKYETEKKELHIASLEKEKQFYTWMGIGGFLLAVSLGVILFLNMLNAKKEKQLIATRSVMTGEMKERTRLARDLHDRLSGNLSSVRMELEQAESLHNVGEKLDNCIDEVRRVAHSLMPASLQYGIKEALEDYSTQFSNVHFHFFGKEERIDERAEFAVYCCASELITNSIRHSEAENINVQLIQEDGYVSLTVQDDGKGYDDKTVEKGLGLKNINDRVTSCNGKIDVFSSEKGTETIIELKASKTH